MSERSRPSLPSEAALSADCRLLVPMRVQVLAVADPDSIEWTDLTPQYDLLNGKEPLSLGCWLRPTLFDPAPEPPGAGIHLHWALPAAFTHIDQAPGSRTRFRSVPNRWLVVRLWGKTPSQLAHRAWVIDSDHLAADGTNPWLTLGEQPRQFDAGKRLGRALDLKDYQERQGPSPLTAVAPGNLAFSNFYPSCRNVFGFYDEAADLERDRDTICAYIVVGWFADPGSDPLSGCAGKDDWLTRMGRLGWSVPAETTALPTRSLCHGAVEGLRWPPRDSDRALNFPRFEIAVGNSALDAIAAFVDRKTASEIARRDRLLGQLQFAVLQDRPPTAKELYSDAFPDRGSLAVLRARLHGRSFTALPGGSRWEIDLPVRDSGQAASQASAALLELPPALAGMLRALNRDQREYDRQQRRLTGLQRDLYAQWHKRRLLTRESLEPRERQERAAALDRRIADLTSRVEQLRHSIVLLKTGIDGTAGALRARTAHPPQDVEPDLRGHVLIERPMPRYWRANDPVLLLAGVPIPAIQGGASPLRCRVTGQTIASLEVDDVPNYGTAHVGVDYLKAEIATVRELFAHISPAIQGDFPDLLCEALLLDPQRAGLLAAIAYLRQKGLELAENDPRIENLAKSLGEAQSGRAGANFFIGTQRATGGAARDAFGAALSATVAAPTPWTPVFMVWQADFRPARDGLPQEVLKTWRFEDGAVDYRWGEPAYVASDSDDVAPHQGYAPLSDTVGRGLAKGKEPFPWKAQYPEDGFIFDVLAGTSVVVQSLGGLTEALLQQDAALQLPPLKDGSTAIDEDMSQLVGEQYAVAPLLKLPDGGPAKFLPIRGGHLDIRRLWLVDTFGRTRRVIETIEKRDDAAASAQVCISRALAVPGNADTLRIQLAPRLAQPSRLLFRWLSANDDGQEFLGDRGTQPVCGWIIPNRLDDSLLICDATGTALGAVQSVIRSRGFDNRGIRWSKLPPAAIDPDPVAGALPRAQRPSARDIPNPHLLGLVNGWLDLADDTGTCRTNAFRDLLALFAELAEIDQGAPGERDLSVLIGRPLALVRASLRLDLLGPPAVDQGWSAFAAPTSTGLADVAFDVRLGDRRLGPDGLIGCFLSDDYGALHLSQDIGPATGQRIDPYFRHRAAVALTCDPDGQATLLSLLIDPRAGVHVSSGILPTKLIDLPTELVSDALARLEVPFLVAPVLGERRRDGVPNIPLPTDMPGEWRWTWRPAPNAKAESAPIKSETAPARSLFATIALYEGWLALRQQGTDRR